MSDTDQIFDPVTVQPMSTDLKPQCPILSQQINVSNGQIHSVTGDLELCFIMFL